MASVAMLTASSATRPGTPSLLTGRSRLVLVEHLEQQREVALVALGPSDEAQPEKQQPGVDQDAEQQPGQRQAEDDLVGEVGEEVEEQGERADAQGEQAEDASSEGELLAQQAAEVDVAECGLLVDVAGPGG